jgi:hypothetical protein
MRGTLGHESATQPSVHVLSVYEVRTGLVLAQRSVAEKENEISAVKELLTPVYVRVSRVDRRCDAYPEDGLSAH